MVSIIPNLGNMSKFKMIKCSNISISDSIHADLFHAICVFLKISNQQIGAQRNLFFLSTTIVFRPFKRNCSLNDRSCLDNNLNFLLGYQDMHRIINYLTFYFLQHYEMKCQVSEFMKILIKLYQYILQSFKQS